MKFFAYPSAILILLLLLSGCNDPSQGAQTDVTSRVSVVELKKESISKLINTTGTVLATSQVDLNSEVSGKYRLQVNPQTRRPFQMGDKVKKGQVIIRLEDPEYENNIAIDVKEDNLELAKQEVLKQKELYEKGGVTQTEIRNSEIRLKTTEYEFENSLISLDRMNIKAPFDGVIVDLPHFTADVKVPNGSLMVSLMAYSKMYMEVNLPESAIGYIAVNQPVNITHYTLPDDTIRGSITEISPAISKETRTFKNKIVVDNVDLKLRPGMFAKADIVVDHAGETIVIPKNVIQTNRRRKFVYVVEKNIAIARDIQTGLEDENNVQVVEGLSENEMLVIRGYETLRNNTKVRIQQ